MDQEMNIHTYYNELASTYDEDRFGNTYGKYIHHQETQFLKKFIRKNGNILDLGCGTGRHLKFATHGVDLSENMIKVSGKKFPDKMLKVGSAFNTGFEKAQFNQVFSFHVFMHLGKPEIQLALNEAHRILQPGGQMIFDIPSDKRRKLLKYKTNHWHGATSMSVDEIRKMMGEEWTIKKVKGILFFPIHRFPKGLRKLLLPFDNLWCSSPFKSYSSYLMIVIEKK
jgi:ubiquinone/menaquinone biosynthesis C-methylase UbiE